MIAWASRIGARHSNDDAGKKRRKAVAAGRATVYSGRPLGRDVRLERLGAMKCPPPVVVMLEDRRCT